MRPRDLHGLTPGRVRALAAIVAYVAEHGRPPTHRELAERLGLGSTQSVRDYCEALHEAGMLVYTPGIARGIALTPEGVRVGAPAGRVRRGPGGPSGGSGSAQPSR